MKTKKTTITGRLSKKKQNKLYEAQSCITTTFYASSINTLRYRYDDILQEKRTSTFLKRTISIWIL